MIYVLLFYNLFVFCMFALDKLYSVKKRRRISENTLLMLSAFMGATGGLCAMFIFNHKTRKLKFTCLMPVFLVLNTVALKFIL